MYRFSFTESVAGKAEEVTRDKFHEIIARADIKDRCAKIAAGNLDEKRRLPAFCWHAWFDEGKRKNDAAHPSGLIMIDVDHVEQPRELFAKIESQAKEMGLVVAHVTPSTHGLRLVFPIPQGMDLVGAQSHYARALGVQVDACTKDLARLSFAVPASYFLFVDEEALFDGVVFEATRSSQEGEGTGALGTAGRPEQPRQEKPTQPTQSEQPSQEKPTQPTQPEQPGQGEPTQPNTPEGSLSPTPYTLNPFESNYENIPYEILVQCLEDQLGGKPAHGSRNNFIFSMAAYLRYVCNDDPNWIASILPTYGETSEKWRRTIDSACQRSQYKEMPDIVKRAIQDARHRLAVEDESEDASGDQLPPAMPKRLPKLIRHLIKNVPECCRPSVANGVFPALGAHLHGVKFWLMDGTEKEATFMCVNLAGQSSGKSAVNKPIEYILADIVERDEVNRKREQEWKDATQTKGANKEKPKRPEDLCVQVLVSDMTNAAFVQRMKDAGDHYLYTNLEELDLLKQLQTNGTKDVGKIICLCFDNGKYGQERVGTQSVTARVEIRWNWNASSTIQKGIQFFKGRMVDGTLSRVNFSTIIRNEDKPFVYGKYDDQYAEELKPFIANLNLATGHIECKQAIDLARKMQEDCKDWAKLSDDEMYEELSYRAVTIAYLKAMVLYIANDMTWSKEIADFAEWSLKYDLWCKMHFFGDQIKEEKAKEKIKRRPGKQNLLDLLPNPFTFHDACELRRSMGLPDEGNRHMVNNWTTRGYVERDITTKTFIKSAKYLKKMGKR